jgi:TM2 domain-containing membrane protein YozV
MEHPTDTPDSVVPRIARRRWWLAALLALFALGAGQLYNGQLRKGLLLAVCVYGVTPE